MQRKAKEQEERAMEQERINEGLKELNREEQENFARCDFIFLIITNCLKKRFLALRTMRDNSYITDVRLHQYYICAKSSTQFIKFHI